MNALETAIYSRLTGTVAASFPGGFHFGLAPQGTAGRYLVLNRMSRVPSYAFGESLVDEDMVYLIKAIETAESVKAARTAIDAAIAALITPALSVTGYGLMLFRREGAVEYPETMAGGPVVWHTGYQCRVMVDPT